MTVKSAFVMLCASLLAVLQPSQAAAQAGIETTERPYRIHAGDELEVFVFGEERLQRQVRVLPDGTFSFPLVGRVVAVGRLPSEVESQITQGLQSQYSGAVPEVTVAVSNPSGLQFSVVGKVRNPGTFNPGRYVNVLEALSFAGGPTEFAEVRDIIIVRKEGDDLVSLPVRLGDTLSGSPSRGDLSNGIPQMQGGDTVIVP